jgi:polyhydroxybutyrate depolymerase
MAGQQLSLEHAGIVRTCRTYRPERLSARPGLVVMLHGAVGSGDEIAAMTGFDREAERLGWVAAYPDALNPGPFAGWDTFSCCPNEYDDVGFIAALVKQLVGDNHLDPHLAFAAGFSRGGMMAHRLGCELSGQLAGIAAVAGNMSDPSGDVDAVPCTPARPISVLIIHGSDDRNVPVEGGTSPDHPDQFAYAPLSDVVRRWRRSNGCTEFAQVRQEGATTIRRWEGDAPVELRLVVGGSHEWFAGASAAIADFFAG